MKNNSTAWHHGNNFVLKQAGKLKRRKLFVPFKSHETFTLLHFLASPCHPLYARGLEEEALLKTDL